MPTTPRIVSARITPLPANLGDPLPQVWVTVDGSEQFLFEYYPDEISFTADDFVNLTVAEAHHLKYERDSGYLR